jgi:hypothetical protein
MNLVQRLVRAISTIGVIQNDGIHFFIAGKCTNQAKPLLPRFSADFVAARIRTRRSDRTLRKIARIIAGPGSQTQCAVRSQEKGR